MPEPVFDIFTVGGTVQAGSGLYLSRNADRELHALCRNGVFAYVLTPRQLGKSSLMVRTASRLAEEGIRSATIDLTQIGVQVTAETWYLGLLAAIEDQLGLGSDVVTWWGSHAHLGVTQRLTLFFQEVLLTEITGSIVIFIDEIDTTLSLAFTDDFYAAIRFFANARAYIPEFHRLSFVLIGVATPGDLIRDPQRTPFNIGQRVDLTDFTFDEALPLADGFGLPPSDAHRVLHRVLWWTGGHPYLTQRLCRALALQQPRTWSDDDVDRAVTTTFLGQMSEQDNNLQFVRDMLTKRTSDRTAVLTAYRQIRLGQGHVVDEEESLIKSHLKLSGVVKRDNATLQVRNRIYNDVFDDRWIKEHLPINWFKRARQAGIFLAAAMLIAAALFGSWTATKARQELARANDDRKNALEEREAAQRERWAVVEEARNELTRAIEIRNKAVKAAKETELSLHQAQEDRAKTSNKLKQAMSANNAALVYRLAGESEVTPLSPKKLLLAVEAAKRSQSPSLEVDRALRRGLYDWPQPLTSPHKFAGVAHAGGVLGIAFSRTGQYLATEGSDHSVSVWEVNNPKKPVATMKHDAPVTAVVFSPVGRYIASASSKKVTLWELASGKLVWDDDVDGASLAFSADGRYLASSSGDSAQVRDAVTGKVIATLAPPKPAGAVTAVTFSPDGQYLATASVDGTACVWAVTSSRLIAQMKHARDVAALAFSPNGASLASGDADGIAWIWRTLSGGRIAQVRHAAAITALEFSRDGKYLGSASKDGTVRVWGAASGARVSEMKHQGAVTAADFSTDGRFLATGSADGTARVWDPASGRLVTQLEFGAEVTAVAFHPFDGRLLATAVKNQTAGGSPETAQVWEILGGSEVAKTEHGRRIVAVEFSPEGDHLAAAGADGTVHVWTTSGTRVSEIEHEGVVNLSLGTEGKYLATAGADDVRVWREGKLLLRFSLTRVVAIALRADGRYLAVATSWQDKDYATQLWDLQTGSQLANMKHDRAVRALSFSPKDRYLATGGDAGAQVWDFNERLVRRFDGTVQAVSFSPDGRYLALAERDTAHIWELATGKQVGGSMEYNVEVMDVAFGALSESRGQPYLSTLTMDNTVSLRDGRTGAVVAQSIYDRTARSTAFSPDGRYIATAGGTEGVRVWPWRQDLLIPLACSRLASNLTWSEWQTELRPEPYRKTCPELPVNTGSFIDGAKAAARAGDFARAVELFQEARKYDPNLNINPKAEALRELAPFKIQLGRTRAQAGDIDGAVRYFREALVLDPKSPVNPEPDARRIASLAKVNRAMTSAREGKGQEALALLHDAERLNPQQQISAQSWNTVCWFGSLLSDATVVMSACERAVELAPTNGSFRDSRGVARAMSGKDIAGAIEDFEAYVESTTFADRKKERLAWIEALRAGTNPAEIFTAQERKRLTAQ